MENSEILTLARKHLADLADGKSGEELAAYFNPAIRQIEYPNLLNPHGGISDFKTLMDRAEKGKHCRSQGACQTGNCPSRRSAQTGR